MPNLEEPEESTQIDPANVPFVPDLYQSEAKSAEIAAEKAGATLPGDVPLPKVVTASAESTLPGAGVSSNIFQKSDDIKAFVGGQSQNKPSEAASKLKGLSDNLANLHIPGLGSVGSLGTSSQSESDPSRKELDQNDVQGLYILLGLVGGGWLLGRLLEKKGTHSTKHGPAH
ncbi:hypothetical protein CPB86DRAFT_780674 [Serendipita vermifera]|nr:hypothetical protein CPB86DRAFT_780674 [Serendipita vermifera]